MRDLFTAIKGTLTIAVLVAILSGCNLSKDTSVSQIGLPREEISLTAGQTEAEVRALLGKPSGVMMVKNRTSLVYGKKVLEFKNGKLMTSEPNVLAQIDQQKEASISHGFEKSMGPKVEEASGWLKERMASIVEFRDSLLEK